MHCIVENNLINHLLFGEKGFWHPALIPTKKTQIARKRETYSEKRKRTEGKYIQINSKVTIDVSNPTSAQNFILDGASSGGKSYLLCIIANQFHDAIIFDTVGGAEKTLKEQKVFDDGWTHWSMGYQAQEGTKLIKINASSLCSSRLINVFRDEFKKSQKAKKIMPDLRNFLALPTNSKKKTYAKLKEIFTAGGMEFSFAELEAILSPTDEGMPISDFLDGKKIINTESLEPDNRSLPTLMNEFFYHRTHGGEEKRKVSDQEIRQATQRRLLIAIDDIQLVSAIAKRTIGEIFSLARKYNISAMTSGTNVGLLDTRVKQSGNVLFIFSAMVDQKTLSQQFGLWEIDFVALGDKIRSRKGEKGWCFFTIRDHSVYGTPKILRPDLSYLNDTDIEEEPKPIVDLRAFYGYNTLQKNR